jgi:hypothetical protein
VGLSRVKTLEGLYLTEPIPTDIDFSPAKEYLDMMERLRMERLSSFEKLKNYPAKVQGKVDIKYIIYNSSVYEENGEFKHTRCYGTEVEKVIYDVFLKHFEF